MWFRNKVWQQKQTAMVKCLLQHDRNTEANTSCNVEHKYSLQCVSISIKVFCSCELISLKEARMQWKKMSCALTPLEIIPKWTSVTSVLLPHQKVGTLACIRTIISLSAVEFYYALLIFLFFFSVLLRLWGRSHWQESAYGTRPKTQIHWDTMWKQLAAKGVGKQVAVIAVCVLWPVHGRPKQLQHRRFTNIVTKSQQASTDESDCIFLMPSEP